MALAEPHEIEAFLAEHQEWSRSGDAITAKFEFSDFNQAMGFVTRVALESEKSDHHPDIDIRWNEVTLTLSTHSEGGLTVKDLKLADTIDGF